MNRRQRETVELLNTTGEVRVGELAGRFGVSSMTVRRDLELLERAGHLIRTHGGAVDAPRSVIEFAFERRVRKHAEFKRRIGRAAAAMIRPGMTITLDTGTTTLEAARAIAAVSGLTVLTSSLAIASALYARENIELILLGGAVRKTSPDLSGGLTTDNLGRFRVDLAVVGADGATPEGLFTTDVNVAGVTHAIIAGAARAVVVADHGKFESAAFVKYAGWDEIDCVVTDSAAPAAVREWLDDLPCRVIYAGEEQGPPRGIE